MSILNKAFHNKKVLVTGHTGFKGSWLSIWLNYLGAEVYGVSLPPITVPSNYECAALDSIVNGEFIDIRDTECIRKYITKLKPDYLFHLAAQPLVRKSYIEPVDTWTTNLIGTVNILDSLRLLDNKCVAILITSDKCYDNVEWIWGYRENDRLGGPDPYSASKGAAELAINSYFKSFCINKDNIMIGSARAGNVIGGGDWAEDRIVPDSVKAWSNNQSVYIRNPSATRPWQHVLEPLSGYLVHAALMNTEINGEAFNYGPNSINNYSVLQLIKDMSAHWKGAKYKHDDTFVNGPYESTLLKLNCDKALHYLGWHSILDFKTTVNFTAEWYRDFYNNQLALDLCVNQIKDYTNIGKKIGIKWAS